MKVVANKTLIASVVLLLMSGCTVLPRNEVPNSPAPRLPNIDMPASPVGQSGGWEIAMQGVVEEDMFIANPAEKNDPLPDIRIPPFSASRATIYDILNTTLEGSGIAFSVDGDHPGSSVLRSFSSSSNISGSLRSVLEMYSKSLGFFYTYHDGVLRIVNDRQFIAKLPPINEIFTSLPDMLKTMGATDVFLDKTSRSIAYRATRNSQEKIENYLQWIRDNKKLIVYETYIAEVVLNDTNNTGIQWNNFSWAGTVGAAPVQLNVAGGPGVGAAGSVGVGAVFNGAHFSMDVLASFLQTQGTVRQISKIPMMLISGGETSFRNGGTDYYVSAIGAPTIAANGTTVPGQTQLTPLKTGIDLKLTGDLYDSTVFTHVSMGLVSLIGYKPFPAGTGQSMQAPTTAERTVDTDVRVRPGDSILIAGINYEKAQTDLNGMPGPDNTMLQTSNVRSAQRTELVVVMRPKVISFPRTPRVSHD